MNGKRFAVLTGLALLGSLAVGVKADAAYNYSTVITITSGTGGGVISKAGGISSYTLANGTVLQLQDIAPSASGFIVGGPLTPNIANVGIVPTAPSPGDTFSVTYRDVITITNPSPGGSTGTFTVTGTLTATNVALTSGQFSGTTSNTFNALNQTIQVDGGFFTLTVSATPNVGYGPPTIGQPIGGAAAGSLSATLNSSVVPEPASVLMVGLGLAGVAGFGLRRRAA